MRAWALRRARSGARVMALALAALAALAGCGHLTTGPAGGSPGAPASATAGTSATATATATRRGPVTLACSTEMSGHGIDTVTAVLRCHVTGAAESDTAFSLTYQIAASDGQVHIFGPTCAGALRGGAGSCAATYSGVVTVFFGKASVAGSTDPGHEALGPVTPTQITPTPNPGATPPFGPILTPIPPLNLKA